jgi:hypothetical protein
MPEHVEPQSHDHSPTLERCGGFRAQWTQRLSRLRWSAGHRDHGPGSHDPLADPITPEVNELVCAAFPPSPASPALDRRLSEIWEQPQKAPHGTRLFLPMLRSVGDRVALAGIGSGAKLCWGSLGALAALLVTVWLMFPQGDVLAAAIRATEAAPLVHVTGTTPTGTFESWQMPGIGYRVEVDDGGKRLILVDDRKRSYLYHVDEGRVEIEPSDLAQPGGLNRSGDVWTGADFLKKIQSWTVRPETSMAEVSEAGVPMRELRVSLPKGERMRVLIDPRTDHITRIDSDSIDKVGETERRRMQFDYPDPKSADPGLFHFKMPKGVWIQDHIGGDGLRPDGDDTRCWKHMDGVMKSLLRAVEENGGRWPQSLRETLGPYEGVELLRCPLDPKGGPDGTSYRYHRPSPEVIAKMKTIAEVRKQHGKVKLPFPWPYDIILLEHCHNGRPILYFDAAGRTMPVQK